MDALSYSELLPEQRHCTNTRLLELTKRLYDATNEPPFLLNDFSILYDADLILQQNSNPELIKALDGYVAKHINYLAGFATLNSTPPNEFVAWASNNYDSANLPIDKIVCTAFYELCQKPALQHELSNKLTIQNTVDAEAVLAQSIGVANGLRNAVLCDGGTISSEYKQSLEKTCNQLLQSFATPAQFYNELNNSELGRILTPTSKRCEYLQEISQDWEHQQDLLLQNLLKQAKCEVIRQQNLQQEQTRIDNFVNTYNEKHGLYTKVLAEHNQVVVDYNAFLDAANKDYTKAHKCELQADFFILRAAQNTYKSARISQNMMGTAAPSHTVEWGISLNPHEGLTFTNKHIVHRGSTVIAAGVTSYNPRIAVGARIANTLAMAQSRKNASIPTVLNYRFAELSGFVNNNGQYLSDFEAPDLQISNPYQECKIIFANEESNSKDIPVFGTNVITNTIKVDNGAKLEQIATPIMPDSFAPEANNSFNNNAIHNLQRDWTPLAQQISHNNSYWHGLVRHVNSAIYSAFSFITGSGAAEASPALVAGQLTAATTASGAIGALAPHQATAPLTFKQLGNELLDLAKKAHLLSAFLIAPTLTGNMVPLLVTPMHQPNPEDLVFPGGGVVVPDGDIPAYEGYERDAGFYNTGHANAGPRYEDVSVPPLRRIDPLPFLNMFKNNNILSPIRNKSIKGRLKAAQLPIEGKIRFVPPEKYNGNSPLERGENNGYYDKFKNEWVKGPSRTQGEEFEWDVQLSDYGKKQLGWATRDGNHLNVSLKGEITHR